MTINTRTSNIRPKQANTPFPNRNRWWNLGLRLRSKSDKHRGNSKRTAGGVGQQPEPRVENAESGGRGAGPVYEIVKGATTICSYRSTELLQCFSPENFGSHLAHYEKLLKHWSSLQNWADFITLLALHIKRLFRFWF